MIMKHNFYSYDNIKYAYQLEFHSFKTILFYSQLILSLTLRIIVLDNHAIYYVLLNTDWYLVLKVPTHV